MVNDPAERVLFSSQRRPRLRELERSSQDTCMEDDLLVSCLFCSYHQADVQVSNSTSTGMTFRATPLRVRRLSRLGVGEGDERKRCCVDVS